MLNRISWRVCTLYQQMTRWSLGWFSTFGFKRYWSRLISFLLGLNTHSAERCSCSSFVIIRWFITLLSLSSNSYYPLDCLHWRGREDGYRKGIRFARAASNGSDFNWRNKAQTAKLLRQGYHYHKLQRFITDTVGWWKNIMLAWRNFCDKVYRNQNTMVT